MRLLPLLLLSGCLHRIPPPSCVSPLGLLIRGDADCEGEAWAEALALKAFAARVGWSRETVGRAVHGYTVSIGEPLSSSHIQPYESNCDLRCIFLMVANWEDSALAHELAHVVNGCNDRDHASWEKQGIWKALEDVRAPGRVP